VGEAEAGHLVRREEGRALRLLPVLRRRGAVRGGHGLELERGNGEGRRGGKLIESRGWREANYRRSRGREGTEEGECGSKANLQWARLRRWRKDGDADASRTRGRVWTVDARQGVGTANAICHGCCSYKVDHPVVVSARGEARF